MTWDLSKLYSGFDAPEFLNDMEELKRSADAAVEQAFLLMAEKHKEASRSGEPDKGKDK